MWRNSSFLGAFSDLKTWILMKLSTDCFSIPTESYHLPSFVLYMRVSGCLSGIVHFLHIGWCFCTVLIVVFILNIFFIYKVCSLVSNFPSFLQATSDNVIVGSKVWVEDPESAWIDGEVTKINGQELHVQTTNGKSMSYNYLM